MCGGFVLCKNEQEVSIKMKVQGVDVYLLLWVQVSAANTILKVRLN